MNLRFYSIVLLASALPLAANAGKGITLNRGDFRAANRISRDGQELVSVKLSKSGKAKLRKLNHSSVHQAVHAEVGGVASDFTLMEPIRGEGLEMGPYSAQQAEIVVNDINGQ